MPNQDSNENSTAKAERMVRVFRDPEIQQLLAKYNKEPPDSLKLARILGASYSVEERHWIAEWISLGPKLREKFETTHSLLCDRLALEQSTAKDLSLWKIKLWPCGSKILDLCCGMGGDSLFLPKTLEVTGVDRDPLRCAMYSENTRVMGTPRQVIHGDALDTTRVADFFQIDPARRDSLQGNQRRLIDLTPNWLEIATLLPHFSGAALKLPPGFPVDALPANASWTYLGNRTDCRECLVTLGSLAGDIPTIRAVCLPENIEFSAPRSLVQELRLQTASLGKYLFEPNPVLLRSHLFPAYAEPLGLWQIDPQIAYLTGDALPPDSPWLNAYEVIDSCPLGTERVKNMLKVHGMKPISLKKRGVEVEPATEIKRLNIKEGQAGILFYTRIQDQKTAILTFAPKKQ